jgi:S1-C subfamily serine protease
MQLQSARDLKKELLDTCVQPFVTASIQAPSQPGTPPSPADFQDFAERLSLPAGSTITRNHRSIALGITKRGEEFAIAIRVQHPGLIHSRLVRQLVARTKKEFDLKFIGRVGKQSTNYGAAARPWYQCDARPMLIGCSVSHFESTRGTLGAFVICDGEECILSNNHVLANENNTDDSTRAYVGDPILQCSAMDGGRVPTESVATLKKWVPLDTHASNTIDAAVASLTLNNCNKSLLTGLVDNANRALQGDALPDYELVYKIGSTTGVTQGKISALELDNIILSYDIGELTFDNVIEITPTGGQLFSDGGDSGALIVNAGFNAVGLLTAGADPGDASANGLTYACVFKSVLSKLNAQLVLR